MARVYTAVINVADKFVPNKLRPLWMHPAGPKTVFFWAPMFKWGLVVAGLSDVIKRPVEVLSTKQTGTIAFTGIIWSRYSLVITPKNWNLFAVNMFVALTQGIQFVRAYRYQMLQKRAIKSE